MKIEDYDALFELASEMDNKVEAARFIRREADCGLPSALKYIDKIVFMYPDSVLARVCAGRPA